MLGLFVFTDVMSESFDSGEDIRGFMATESGLSQTFLSVCISIGFSQATSQTKEKNRMHIQARPSECCQSKRMLLVKLMSVNSPCSIFPVLAKKDTVKCKL